MAVVLVATAVLWRCVPAVASAPEATSVSYKPPVDAPVVDSFRPPPKPWEAGNRGIDYGTTPGTPVLAAAAGEVVFSGPVAGSLHVVVLHADGVRTSYSFLRSIGVHRGDRVERGQPVGTSGERLHFGARIDDQYIDPAELFRRGPPRVYLVPESKLKAVSEGDERRGLLRSLGRALVRIGSGAAAGATWGARKAAAGVDWARRQAAKVAVRAALGIRVAGAMAFRKMMARLSARFDELLGILHYVRALDPRTHAVRVARHMHTWWKQRRNCTPDKVVPPRVTPGQRKVVMVAGLGSTSAHAAVWNVNTSALGYAPDDVVRFSYKGGTAERNPYIGADTTADLRHSGRRLRELLQRVAAENPGVPIDIIAHSQGGLVARTALAYEYDGLDPQLPQVNSLVTVGTPHQGADGATLLDMTARTTPGMLLQSGAHLVKRKSFDPRGDSVRQMSETSAFLRKLNRRRLPAGLWATSIGARGDLIVSGGHTRLPGANNVVVSVPGVVNDHSNLPSSTAAQREIALALARMPPTCQQFLDSLADAAVSTEISAAEDALGAAAYLAGKRFGSGRK